MDCEKYIERPQIGQVTALTDSNVTINWFIGTYSGMWKPWRVRSQGKMVYNTEEIPLEDVFLTGITFGKTMRLSSKTVLALKDLY